MVYQKGDFVLDLKPLISQCSPSLRVIELPILGTTVTNQTVKNVDDFISVTLIRISYTQNKTRKVLKNA